MRKLNSFYLQSAWNSNQLFTWLCYCSSDINTSRLKHGGIQNFPRGVCKIKKTTTAKREFKRIKGISFSALVAYRAKSVQGLP